MYIRKSAFASSFQVDADNMDYDKMSEEQLIALIKSRDKVIEEKAKEIKNLKFAWYIWMLRNRCSMEYLRSINSTH